MCNPGRLPAGKHRGISLRSRRGLVSASKFCSRESQVDRTAGTNSIMQREESSAFALQLEGTCLYFPCTIRTIDDEASWFILGVQL